MVSLSDRACSDINDAGVLAGTAPPRERGQEPIDVLVNGQACLYVQGRQVLLPVPRGLLGGSALRINNRGTVAGCITPKDWEKTGQFSAAVLWRKGEMIRMPGDWGGRWQATNGIREDDTVVGELEDREMAWHPFLWQGGKVTLLPLSSGSTGSAISINRQGEIVGYSQEEGRAETRACIWVDRKIFDLLSLVTNSTGWQLRMANDINDAGQIVGDGRHDGKDRGFRLDPITT